MKSFIDTTLNDDGDVSNIALSDAQSVINITFSDAGYVSDITFSVVSGITTCLSTRLESLSWSQQGF